VGKRALDSSLHSDNERAPAELHEHQSPKWSFKSKLNRLGRWASGPYTLLTTATMSAPPPEVLQLKPASWSFKSKLNRLGRRASGRYTHVSTATTSAPPTWYININLQCELQLRQIFTPSGVKCVLWKGAVKKKLLLYRRQEVFRCSQPHCGSYSLHHARVAVSVAVHRFF